MSLLMDALRRAEEEKRRAAERAAAEGQPAESPVIGADALGQASGTGTLPADTGPGARPFPPAPTDTQELSLEPIAQSAQPASGEGSGTFASAADADLDRPDASAPGSSTIERALAALGLADASGELRDPEVTRESVKLRESAGEATLPSTRALRSSLREFFDTSQSVEARGSLEGTSPTVPREGGTGPDHVTPEVPEAAPQAVDYRTGRSGRVSAQAVLTAAHHRSSSHVFTLLMAGLFLVATALGAVGFYYYAQTLPASHLTLPTRSVAQFEPPLPPEALRPPGQSPATTTAQDDPATAAGVEGVTPPAAGGVATDGIDAGAVAAEGRVGATDAASTAQTGTTQASTAQTGTAQIGATQTGITPVGTAATGPDQADAGASTPEAAADVRTATGAAAAAGTTRTTARPAAAAALAATTAPAGAPAAPATTAGDPVPGVAVAGPPAASAAAASAGMTEPHSDSLLLLGPEGAPPISAAVRISRSRREATLAPGLMDAYAAWRRGDLAAAERGYRAVLAREPDLRDALLGLAGVAVARGDARAAAGLYREVLERDPRDSIAKAGLLMIQGGEGAAADVAGLQLMLDEEPAAAHLHFALGNHHARAQRWREAQAAYFEAWRLEVDNADYAFNLAVALDQLAQQTAATEYYRRALSNAARSRLQPAFDRSAVEVRLRALQAAAAAAP